MKTILNSAIGVNKHEYEYRIIAILHAPNSDDTTVQEIAWSTFPEEKRAASYLNVRCVHYGVIGHRSPLGLIFLIVSVISERKK